MTEIQSIRVFSYDTIWAFAADPLRSLPLLLTALAFGARTRTTVPSRTSRPSVHRPSARAFHNCSSPRAPSARNLDFHLPGLSRKSCLTLAWHRTLDIERLARSRNLNARRCWLDFGTVFVTALLFVSAALTMPPIRSYDAPVFYMAGRCPTGRVLVFLRSGPCRQPPGRHHKIVQTGTGL